MTDTVTDTVADTMSQVPNQAPQPAEGGEHLVEDSGKLEKGKKKTPTHTHTRNKHGNSFGGWDGRLLTLIYPPACPILRIFSVQNINLESIKFMKVQNEIL